MVRERVRKGGVSDARRYAMEREEERKIIGRGEVVALVSNNKKVPGCAGTRDHCGKSGAKIF